MFGGRGSVYLWCWLLDGTALSLLVLAQSSADPYSALASFGAVGSICAVLLYTFIAERKETAAVILKERKENNRAIRSLSVTMVNLQQFLLVQSFQHRLGSNDCEECRAMREFFENLKRILDAQKDELERLAQEP